MASELPVFIAVDHVTLLSSLLGDGVFDGGTVGSSVVIGTSPTKYLGLEASAAPYIDLPAPATAIVIGMRLYFEFVANDQFIVFQNGSGQEILNLYRAGVTGVVQVRRGTAVLGSTTTNFNGAPGDYFEASIVFDNTVGQVDINVNGVNEVSVSGVDTVNNAGPLTRVVYTSGGGAGNKTVYHRDGYLKERSSGITDFYGPIALIPLRVASDYLNEWTPSAGSLNSEMVDEVTTDGDTTYVEASTPDDTDLFHLESLSSTDSAILALQLVVNVRAPNGGAPIMGLAIDDGTTRLVSSDRVVANSTFGCRAAVFETQADGSSPWDEAAIDAHICGYKYISTS